MMIFKTLPRNKFLNSCCLLATLLICQLAKGQEEPDPAIFPTKEIDGVVYSLLEPNEDISTEITVKTLQDKSELKNPWVIEALENVDLLALQELLYKDYPRVNSTTLEVIFALRFLKDDHEEALKLLLQYKEDSKAHLPSWEAGVIRAAKRKTVKESIEYLESTAFSNKEDARPSKPVSVASVSQNKLVNESDALPIVDNSGPPSEPGSRAWWLIALALLGGAFGYWKIGKRS